jgi:hypothetical protein
MKGSIVIIRKNVEIHMLFSGGKRLALLAHIKHGSASQKGEPSVKTPTQCGFATLAKKI